MRATIYQLRHDGVRMKEAEWKESPVGPGILLLKVLPSNNSCVKVMTFSSPPNHAGRTYELVAKLFEPEMMHLENSCLRVRGFQKTHEGRLVVQEWFCDLL